MRLLLALGVAVLVAAAPASAQVEARALLNAGYDVGFGAPSVGAAGEVTWAPARSGVRVGVRVLADYVALAQTAFPGQDVDGDLFGRQSSALRTGVAAVARWEGAPLPVAPYVQYGLAWEETWEHFPVTDPDPADAPGWPSIRSSSTSGLTAFSGLGLSWRAAYVEAAYGVAVRSYARPNVGGGRVAVGVRL